MEDACEENAVRKDFAEKNVVENPKDDENVNPMEDAVEKENSDEKIELPTVPEEDPNEDDELILPSIPDEDPGDLQFEDPDRILYKRLKKLKKNSWEMKEKKTTLQDNYDMPNEPARASALLYPANPQAEPECNPAPVSIELQTSEQEKEFFKWLDDQSSVIPATTSVKVMEKVGEPEDTSGKFKKISKVDKST